MMYIITGLPRSGSSMMMLCLSQSMPFAADDSQDYLNERFGKPGYVPNPNGFFALNVDFSNPDIIAQLQGKVVKVPYFYLDRLPAGEYKVCFMLRNPAEIKASISAVLNSDLVNPAALLADDYYTVVPDMISGLEAHNIQVTQLQYADVVANPEVEFNKLIADGWEFDVAAAVSQVDPALQRFNLEVV